VQHVGYLAADQDGEACDVVALEVGGNGASSRITICVDHVQALVPESPPAPVAIGLLMRRVWERLSG
jgi:hypothetical protein